MTSQESSSDGRGPSWLAVCPTAKLGSSSRHHLTLRHRDTQEYHSLLIFSFPSANGSTAPSSTTYYCMEATCPHLGAPLENAVIEGNETELEDDIEDMVVVCPWHEYDFSLKTGESSHGISACVYACEVREDQLYIETPKPSHSSETSIASRWDLIELRPVSEAAPSVSARQDVALDLHLRTTKLNLSDSGPEEVIESSSSSSSEQASASGSHSATCSIPAPDPAPKTLTAWAVLVLSTPEPAKKVAYTRYAAKAFRSGSCKLIGGGRWSSDSDSGTSEQRRWITKPEETPPERPPRMKEEVRVRPGQEGKRGKGGSEKSRIAILHSLANIEQWAIDLAWDIIARAPKLCAEFFSTDDAKGSVQKMPLQFFSDFVKVAEDEAKHFSLLSKRLEEMGSYFGALPVHHGLWDSAMDTAHSLTARLSIIHLVHEARGLDVNPTTIKKFENAGDAPSVETLTVIHLDEITHVSAGHRWLTYLCNNARPRPLDPVKVFREEVHRNFIGRLKGPFNAEDRKKAGLDKVWYDDLVGEKKSRYAENVGVQRSEIPGG